MKSSTSKNSAAFPFCEFEPKWQSHWVEHKTYRTPGPGEKDFDASKPKYYILDMFPYPSGTGLHVGHPEGYTATDIVGRYKRMNGFNVLHPMGWDAFGLPAEQYAIKTGQHPRITTEANIDNFRRQLQALGFAYDWDREVNTTDPGYVKWTQWIFLKLYKSYFCEETQKAQPVSLLQAKGWTREQIDDVRLAFIHEAPVNWSPSMGTVLANEEVEEWKAKGETVERRPLRQWMLRITDYSQRLIDELEPLDWPESIKSLQRNWIGRSEGAEVEFTVLKIEQEKSKGEEDCNLAGGGKALIVFTTRPDTLFGATYLVLAPEHPLVADITTSEQSEAVSSYQEACASKSDLERGDLNKDKSGVATGAYATNPVNGEAIPIWIADYVMMGYGTGAIMAVPAHDERDFEFAQKFELPVTQVVQPEVDGKWQGFTGNGISVNSGFLDGLQTLEAKAKVIDWLECEGKGSRKIQYKLRDWLFSRQRYWGEPFPLLWAKESGKHEPVPEDELPLLQPEMEDFKPTGDPRGPLVRATDWINYSDQFERETNTMPQWAGSCWYYLRYCDPANEQAFISGEAEDYWSGDSAHVDLYIGGTEHAVLHLLYARFWHKVLNDLGHLSTNEPFKKLVNQGLIMGEDGQKMSKSLGNVVNPDEVVERYGADSLRLYEMFMGPLEQVKPWSMKGVEGVSRFLAKVWRLQGKVSSGAKSGDLGKITHATIKKVGEDIEALRFNTAISAMMECVNAYTKSQEVPRDIFLDFLRVLNPFAPHITEEINSQLGETGLLSEQTWPSFDESLLVESEITIIVQVNGKLRAKLQVPADVDKAILEEAAKCDPNVQQHIEGKTVDRVITVPGRLLNIITM